MNTLWRRETSASLQLGKLGLHWPLASALSRVLPPQAQSLVGTPLQAARRTPLSFSVLGITNIPETLGTEVNLRISVFQGLLRQFPNICVGIISLLWLSPSANSTFQLPLKPLKVISDLPLPTIGVSEPVPLRHWGLVMVCLLWLSVSIPDRP